MTRTNNWNCLLRSNRQADSMSSATSLYSPRDSRASIDLPNTQDYEDFSQLAEMSRLCLHQECPKDVLHSKINMVNQHVQNERQWNCQTHSNVCNQWRCQQNCA